MDPRYSELAGRIDLEQSKRAAALFEMMCDPVEADLLLALPAQAPQLAQQLELSEAQVEEMLKVLFVKGLVFPSSRTDPPTWRMPHNMIQFHDATILWPDAPEGFLELWREFMNEEWYGIARTMGKKTEKPYTRIIPVGVSIEAKSAILDSESVKEIIENAKNIAVTACTCRLSMQNCERPLEVCLQVNNAADYTLARGTGRKLNKQEALDILQEAEEAGLLHVTMNRQDKHNFICNCCPCCCQTMPVLIEGGVKVVDPSRFTAVIDADECSGCGLCHERCYFGAISWSDGEGSPSLVDAEKCMGCGLCMVTCPEEAITLDETRSAEFVPGAA